MKTNFPSIHLPLGMNIGYADPPYLGCGKLYADKHPDALAWDDPETHRRLVERLSDEFHGWVLHLSATPESILLYAEATRRIGVRWCAWVKGFAAYKRNVPVAYAWEPVLVKAARKPVVSGRQVMRDWIECPITLRRGCTGAKPEKVCHWAFEVCAARPEDHLSDLFPGSGAVTQAWDTWTRKFVLPVEPTA